LSQPFDVRDSDSGFTLDSSLLARRKARNERRLATQQIPAIRAGGFAVLCAIVWLQEQQAPADGRMALTTLFAINAAYVAFGWLLLRIGHGRSGRLDLVMLMFHLDLLVWLVNLHRIEPGPGQESVWDYPRPPRLEASTRHLQVVFGGETVADSRSALRVL